MLCSQSDPRKVLELPQAVMDIEPHGVKSLDILSRCGIKYVNPPVTDKFSTTTKSTIKPCIYSVVYSVYDEVIMYYTIKTSFFTPTVRLHKELNYPLVTDI